MYYFSKEGIKSVEFEKYVQPDLSELSSENGKGPRISVYFYHPDHLGTNNLVTDMNGKIYQYFLNLPYGETMAEQSGSDYFQSPWKYNGKELDAESGLYYYGARYYDARISMWFGIDPLMEKFPSLTPFIFCNNNPVFFVDPNGKIPWPISKNGSGVGWNTKFGWFGEKRATYVHQGVDINKNTGRDTDFGFPVYATHSGKVFSVTNNNDPKDGRGTAITIQSTDGSYQTVYMHLNTVDIAPGDNISEGQKIGSIGKSGFGDDDYYAAHLHYEIQKLIHGKYVPINPESKRGELIDAQKLIYGDDSQLTMISNTDGLSFSAKPNPKFSTKLQQNKMPIVKTLGDILSIFGL